MKRTDFLRLSALALAAAPFSAFTSSRFQSKKVLVIGAGMAGAAAAHRLRELGAEVVVLEARNRAGGRIHTSHDWGFPLELGANWIHDSRNPQNPLRDMARNLGVATRPTNYLNLAITDAENRTVPRSKAGLYYLRLLREMYRAGSQLTEADNRSLREVFDEVVQKTGDGGNLRLPELAEASFVNNLAAPINDASAAYYLSPDLPSGSRDLLVTGGYVRLVENLLSGIDVRYGQAVRVVRDTGTRVVVETGSATFEADEVIVTIPISLLQSGAIRFEPCLPEWKTAAFPGMQTGAFNKVFMQFETAFWPRNAHFLCYTEARGGADIMVNYQHFGGKPVLVAMPVAAAAQETEQMDEAALRQKWENILRRAQPKAEVGIEKIFATAWGRDPYSLGAYSHVPPGSTGRQRQALSAPVGRIRFAGEATAGPYHSTVHGAWLSGRREAEG